MGSDAVMSVWRRKRIVSFGRASSDGYSRTLLSNVVVVGNLQRYGFLHDPGVAGVERPELIVTKSNSFFC